ncbi:hypothetical protein LIER_18174 [Lithospermum erythrorhizon]|uniref:Uncharacterized protein n=1 Tax=Lithospermum erythrorhizon TaxID=34254 RepID=A0AAV3QD18_LITER
MLTTEVCLPTSWQYGFDEEQNDQRLMELLNFTDEDRDKALYKMLKYKQLLTCTYNRRVRNRQFRLGDWWRLFTASHPKEQSKLSPKWEEPYRIKRILGPGTYELEDLGGKPIARAWHATKLCKYFYTVENPYSIIHSTNTKSCSIKL